MSDSKEVNDKVISMETNDLASEVMNNPSALALMQSKLASMVGLPSGYYAKLPKCMKRRVKALKKLQVDSINFEAKFHEEVYELERKYMKLYESLYNKRTQIVNAKVEPTDEECDFPSDVEDEEEDGEEKKDAEKKIDEKKEDDDDTGYTEDTKGIPEFWLTIMKNVDIIAENIQEHDEPILSHLTDIQLKLVDNSMNFILEFHFSPNDFFTNEILTKEYELRCKPDEKDPFSFEGPEIVRCKGCEINWKKDKNVTMKTIIKKQKHKSKGSVRTVPTTVPNDSFFNFFDPPEVPENEDDLDDETQALLSADFEIGEVLRQRIIPRAVLYYTGEALDDDDYEDDEEDEDEEFEDEDEEEEEEEAPKKGAHKAAGKDRKQRGNAKAGEECKQQ